MVLLDTHVLVWLVNGSSRLGGKAKQLIEKTAFNGEIFVSAITPMEIGMLVAKSRLSLSKDVLEWVNEALAQPGIFLQGLLPEIAVASTRLPHHFHGDSADRIIIASARYLNAPVVTADRQILAYAREGHLQAIDAGK
jgi:PIN domain nuclease of toxin-antitoxin system